MYTADASSLPCSSATAALDALSSACISLAVASAAKASEACCFCMASKASSSCCFCMVAAVSDSSSLRCMLLTVSSWLSSLACSSAIDSSDACKTNGMSQPPGSIRHDIPWSTPHVHTPCPHPMSTHVHTPCPHPMSTPHVHTPCPHHTNVYL